MSVTSVQVSVTIHLILHVRQPEILQNCSLCDNMKTNMKYEQEAQLSQRDRAAPCLNFG